ncbi:hypothetical protein, partial [Fervidobacterium sp.]
MIRWRGKPRPGGKTGEGGGMAARVALELTLELIGVVGVGLLLWGLAPGMGETLAHFTVGQDAVREVTNLQRYAGGWWKVWMA